MTTTARRYLITATLAAAMSGAALLGTAPAWADARDTSSTCSSGAACVPSTTNSVRPGVRCGLPNLDLVFTPDGPPIRPGNGFDFAPSDSISVGG
jgi:hypothetical protein